MVGSAVVLAIVYAGIVFLLGFILEKLKILQKPIVKKKFAISLIQFIGMILFVGGLYVVIYSCDGIVDMLGVIGGSLFGLIGIGFGVIVAAGR